MIAAAGSGERLGAGGPKAFVPVGGRALVEWSLDAFRGCDGVGAIVVAAPPDLGDYAFGEDLTVVAGGATRAESVSNALAVVESDFVAIHDAARPLVTPALIEELLATLEVSPEAAGVIAAAPLTDTVKRVAPPALTIVATEDRSELWAAQTPQVFRLPALRAALEVDAATRDAATDEAALIEAAGGTVLIHPTGPENLKVTTPHDLRVAELLLGLSP